MDRTIKFRGKDNNGKWREGCYVKFEGLQGAIYFPIYHRVQGDEFKIVRTDWCYVDEETVGQFTGLRDKNGKDIYEGDILRIKEYKNLSMGPEIPWEESEEMRKVFTLEDLKGEMWAESVSPVCWEESMFLVSIDCENDTYLSCLCGDMKRSQPIFDFEVIGNVYDNPDIEMKLSDRHKKKESSKNIKE